MLVNASSTTTSNNSSPSRQKKSEGATSSNNNLAKALFHAEAETKELRAELARVHANAAAQKSESIRESQQQNVRIKILQDEITSERGISGRESTRVHELEQQVGDVMSERDTFKELYERAVEEKEEKILQPPNSPSIKTIQDIEKMAATAQIQALEGKIIDLEDEIKDMEKRVERAMKMAREAQTAEQELEETVQVLREELAKEAKKPPTPVKVDLNKLQQQQEDSVNRAKKSIEARMTLEHTRLLSKMKLEYDAKTERLKLENSSLRESLKFASSTASSNSKELEIELQTMQTKLLQDKSKILSLEEKVISLTEAMLTQERALEVRIVG